MIAVAEAPDQPRDVFGWDMKKLESQVDPKVELWMCETEDENGRKGIPGGMMKRNTLPSITNYISVNSIDEYISKINKSGGKVTMPRTEIPNVGSFAMFLDSEITYSGCLNKDRIGLTPSYLIHSTSNSIFIFLE